MKAISKLAALLVVAALVAGLSQSVGATVPTNGLVSATSNDAVGNASSGLASMSADGRFVAFDSMATNLTPGAETPYRDVFVRDTRTGQTMMVSRNTIGDVGNGQSRQPAISGNGRFVVFESIARNLDGDGNTDFEDIYAYDTSNHSVRLVSRAANGSSNGASIEASISDDGNLVAFRSTAANLLSEDGTNRTPDIFVRNLLSDSLVQASVSSAGLEGDGPSGQPEISANGRFVVFTSRATNLVPNDNNGLVDRTDVFVRDLVERTTVRVSVDSNGREGNNTSTEPAISADGRFVVFSSDASNLVDGDINDLADIFVHDMTTRVTRRVNVSTTGVEADDGDSETPDISADGRYVVFDSEADNLVPNDTNKLYDVFGHDTVTGVTTRLSLDFDGRQAIGDSFIPSISADGRRVAFQSDAPGFSTFDDNRTFDVFLADTPEPSANPGPNPTPGPAVPQCAERDATVILANGDVPTEGDDVIVGTSGADEIRALAGDDVVCGGGGRDLIRGGPGEDLIYGQGGRDRLYGGSSSDTIFGGRGRDWVTGNSGNDRIDGGRAADVLKGGKGNDEVNGGTGADTIRGGSGRDLLDGERGADRLFGGRGLDRCFGGPGRDALKGC